MLKSKYLILILLFFSLFFSIYVVNEKEEINSSSLNEKIDLVQTISYIDHDPIEFDSNDDFDTSDAVVSGTGYWNEPYIIEGWDIIAVSGHGISIHDTTVHFIIRDCRIEAGTGGTSPYTDSAIFINNTADGTAWIEDNQISNSHDGILIGNSNDVTVYDNIIDNVDYGITNHYSNGTIINDNRITNTRFAIHLWESSHCDIINNFCDQSDDRSIFVGSYYGDDNYNNITNNICKNSNYGISLSASRYNMLINNTCIFNYYGFYIAASSNNLMDDNYLLTGNYGYYSVLSDSNTIINNIIANFTSYGLYFDSPSDLNLIYHNEIFENGVTPQAFDDSGNIWYDDTINEGNWWSDYSGSGNYDITGAAGAYDPYPNNFVPKNGYYRYPIFINQDSDFDAAHGVVSGIGTEINPYIIENWKILTETGHGIYIGNTNAYFEIKNCYINAGNSYQGTYPDSAIFINDTADGTAMIEGNTCFESAHSILVYYSNYANVTNNHCSNNSLSSINIEYSNNVSVIRNKVVFNEWGIEARYSNSTSIIKNICYQNDLLNIVVLTSQFAKVIENTCSDSYYNLYFEFISNSTIANNTCTYGSYGIYATFGCLDNSMINNTCNFNSQRGISLEFSCRENYITKNTCSENFGGILLAYDSHNNTVTDNNFLFNNIGVRIFDSNYNEISYNWINNSVTYGVSINYASDYNIIHHNYFTDSGETSQAYDDGENNDWYDDTVNEGNIWSDYSGTGDYLIAGTAGSYDIYPFGKPIIPEFNNTSLLTLILLVNALGLSVIFRKRRY